MSALSRRTFLGAGAAAVGAATLGRFGRRGTAQAQTVERTAILQVWFGGQYPALLAAADAMVGNYGMTAADVEVIGNGLAIDKTTYGTLSPFAKSHMATIGVFHGITDHYEGSRAMSQDGYKAAYLTELAAAIGGDGALKAVHLGESNSVTEIARPVGGVSIQRIASLKSLCEILGLPLSAPPAGYDRKIASPFYARAAQLSSGQTMDNPISLTSLGGSYAPTAAALRIGPPMVTYQELDQAYGLNGSTSLGYSDFPAKMAAAELAIRAGANTASLSTISELTNAFWDSHGGGGTGQMERALLNANMPAIRTFCSRMLEQTGLNMIVLLMGEFSHEGTGHNPCLSATVVGKYVKTGTTGRPAKNNAVLPRETPRIPEFWAYVAAVAKLSGSPYGPNPHALVL